MATKNINKIVRGNLNFKPWIGAKSPNEIVNSYVQKFYKQVPDNFRNDLIKPRAINRTPENRIHLRNIVPEKFKIPIIMSKPTSKLRSNGYRSPTNTRKNSLVTAPKKFIKTSNFKIYTKGSIASSVFSSKSSFTRYKTNISEEYRRKIYKPFDEISHSVRANETFILNSNYKKKSLKTFDSSNAIVKDLMSVDEVLKKKICPLKKKVTKADPFEISNRHRWEFNLKKLENTSSDHFNKLSTLPVIKRAEKCISGSIASSGNSSFRLMPIKRKLFGTRLSNTLMLKKQNVKIRSAHKGLNIIQKTSQTNKQSSQGNENLRTSRPKYEGLKFINKFVNKSIKDRIEEYSENWKGTLDFICLGQSDKNIRTSQRGFQKNFRYV